MRLPRITAFFALALLASTIWILFLIPGGASDPASARIPLLAVSVDEAGEERFGGIAYLNLRIVDGSGNVYIHSDPLTKIDTQASTTYAQRFACGYADVDCDRYDFLYSIESNAPIVGGPSAGSAAAAITYAVLTGQRIPQNVAVTGTISSGGVIGNVGGIPQKVEAAQRGGLRSVIIPYLSNFTESDERVDVIRAESLTDIIEGLGLQAPQRHDRDIIVPSSYRDTMRDVGAELCSEQDVPQLAFRTEAITTAYERIENLTRDAQRAYESGDYYTQASHCFNIRVQRYYLQIFDSTKDLSDAAAANTTITLIEANLSRSREVFDAFSATLENPDLNDIQIYSIVEERHRESRTVGEALIEEIGRESASSEFRTRFDENTLFSTAYVLARIDSMESWMRFASFEKGSPISPRTLRQACARKLSAATELSEYTSYITGMNTLDVSSIYTAHQNADYAVCIYQASLLTARAETFLSTIGTQQDDLPELYEAKQKAAYDAIADQTNKGHFPVMAYSYYEYAQSLSDTNLPTALLYIENALSLAELDLYLEGDARSIVRFDDGSKLAFALGIFTMAGIGLIVTAGGSRGSTKNAPRRRLKRIGKK